MVGLLTQARPIQAMAMIANRDKIARGIDRAKSGLGSLGKKMGDFRERVTGYRTQSEYDQAREDRRAQKRTDRMIDRISRGKKTSIGRKNIGTSTMNKHTKRMRKNKYRGQGR